MRNEVTFISHCKETRSEGNEYWHEKVSKDFSGMTTNSNDSDASDPATAAEPQHFQTLFISFKTT